MTTGDKISRQKPFRVETVRGEPYHIGGQTLIPVARHISFGKARGTIGLSHIGGWGVGYALTIPAAIIAETVEGERHIAITDATSNALRRIFGAAMLSTFLLVAIRWLARRWR
jgi:hypothetical protein